MDTLETVRRILIHKYRGETMSIENVKLFFKKYGMESQIQEFSVSSATVALAAETVTAPLN